MMMMTKFSDLVDLSVSMIDLAFIFRSLRDVAMVPIFRRIGIPKPIGTSQRRWEKAKWCRNLGLVVETGKLVSSILQTHSLYSVDLTCFYFRVLSLFRAGQCYCNSLSVLSTLFLTLYLTLCGLTGVRSPWGLGLCGPCRIHKNPSLFF